MKPSTYSLKILLLSLLLLLNGCRCPNVYTPMDNPPPLPQYKIPLKVRLALVLGGGGAKGLAHIGVLEEFEQAGIPIDMIIGCSAGSLVGAVYCDYPCAQTVRTILEPMKSSRFLDINIFDAWYGLSQGTAMKKSLEECLEADTFDQLKIPLLIVATDLYSGELVTFGGGPVIPAVRASCAVPVVYVPVQHCGRVFVDGGVIDPVPVRIAKTLNPDLIVAVDLGGLLDKTFPGNVFGVAKRSAEITLMWQSEACLKDADFLIRPEVGNFGTFEDGLNELIYQAGREAAKKVIPQIKQRMDELANNDNTFSMTNQ